MPNAALDGFGVESNIEHLIFSLLSDRMMVTVWGSTRARRNVSRDTPQGKVLSPFLWILVVNELIKKLEESGCHEIACANDVALMV